MWYKFLFWIFVFWWKTPAKTENDNKSPDVETPANREADLALRAGFSSNSPISLNEYQKQAFTVAQYPEKGTGSLLAVAYCGLGLGEAGEVQGKIKKVMRDSGGKITLETRDAIIDETSDVLWYVAALCTELGITLDELAKRNLEKLFDRKERGVICGSGDKR